ncbi:hypothetical protein SUGI_0666330 [Cryptomeria japonica]|nr:hypothetical protein SUGI_0666330 [Cryptomeria japonica]
MDLLPLPNDSPAYLFLKVGAALSAADSLSSLVPQYVLSATDSLPSPLPRPLRPPSTSSPRPLRQLCLLLGLVLLASWLALHSPVHCVLTHLSLWVLVMMCLLCVERLLLGGLLLLTVPELWIPFRLKLQLP